MSISHTAALVAVEQSFTFDRWEPDKQTPLSRLVWELLLTEVHTHTQKKISQADSETSGSGLSSRQPGGRRGQQDGTGNALTAAAAAGFGCLVFPSQPEKEAREDHVGIFFLSLTIMQHVRSDWGQREGECRSEAMQDDHE